MGRILTQSTASLVVACSSTILSLGKSPASFRKCERKCFSAFSTEMFCQVAMMSRRKANQLECSTKWWMQRTLAYQLVIARYLSVQVQDHAFLFQSLEDGVVRLVRLDTTRRVGSDSSGVRLDACESRLA